MLFFFFPTHIIVCILPFLSHFVPVACMVAWLLEPFTLSCVVSLIGWCSVTRLAKKRITLPQWQVETNSLGQEHTSTARVQLVSGSGKKKPLFCMMESSNICFMSLHWSRLRFCIRWIVFTDVSAGRNVEPKTKKMRLSLGATQLFRAKQKLSFSISLNDLFEWLCRFHSYKGLKQNNVSGSSSSSLASPSLVSFFFIL